MSAIPAGYKQTEVGVIPEDWTSASVRPAKADWLRVSTRIAMVMADSSSMSDISDLGPTEAIASPDGTENCSSSSGDIMFYREALL